MMYDVLIYDFRNDYALIATHSRLTYEEALATEAIYFGTNFVPVIDGYVCMSRGA